MELGCWRSARGCVARATNASVTCTSRLSPCDTVKTRAMSGSAECSRWIEEYSYASSEDEELLTIELCDDDMHDSWLGARDSVLR